jgi:hypothetical protein
MLLVLCPPQVAAVAFSRNVLGTVEPFTGDETVTPVPTVMATSFSQNVPFPQDFTRSVCVPCDALTLVLIEVAGLNTVSDPESIEYAMLTVDCDRHVADVACNTNGELTTAPLAGADTETSAATANGLKSETAASKIAQATERTTGADNFTTSPFEIRKNAGHRRCAPTEERLVGGLLEVGTSRVADCSNRCGPMRYSWDC